MEIVIDIPDGCYEELNSGRFPLQDAYRLVAWIKNGTPLPKGHGRIIDYGYVVDAIDDWINAEEYCYTNGTDYLRNRIRNVPTIIEAEGSESE